MPKPKRNIEAEARKAAEAIVVELADEFAPVIKRLTTAQFGDVVSTIQLAWLRGHLQATTEHGDALRAMMPGIGKGILSMPRGAGKTSLAVTVRK